MFKPKLFLPLALIAIISTILFLKQPINSNLPVIAIANYGPHSSLHETINSLKTGLAQHGYEEGKHIEYEIAEVNFEPTLIAQMLSKLKASKPKVVVALTTPVAQAAKNTFKDIPIVFTAITDPKEAGLIGKQKNITGATDKQDLKLMISFVLTVLPKAKTIGMLYSTSEANDMALVKMMKEAAKHHNIELLLVPVEQAKDIPFRMRAFKDKVDFIYVGVSGVIQPALPAIVSSADQMNIPVINADSDAVKSHLSLGSFGVNYSKVGSNTARIVSQILEGKSAENIPVLNPSVNDHTGYLSKRKAQKLGITLPTNRDNIQVIE